jgi:hypothetical protein
MDKKDTTKLLEDKSNAVKAAIDIYNGLEHQRQQIVSSQQEKGNEINELNAQIKLLNEMLRPIPGDA